MDSELLGEVREDIKWIRDRVVIHDGRITELFGNHQPGVITLMKKDIDELNKFKWKIAGVVASLVFLMEILHVLLEGGFKFIR